MPSKSILTLTLNAAIDRIILVENLKLGTKNIALESYTYYGGKGINVAYALCCLGTAATAAGFIGKPDKAMFEKHIQSVKGNTSFVAFNGKTRNNYKLITQSTGQETEINEQGAAISAIDLGKLDAMITELLPRSSYFILSGSIPPGVPTDIYAQLIRKAKAAGVPCALDVSGKPLKYAASENPNLLKINRSELEELTGTQFTDKKSLVTALHKLCRGGIPVCAASLGADGAIITDGSQTWIAEPPAVPAKSPIGAGDVMLAGMTAARLQHKSLSDTLLYATAMATASVTNHQPGRIDLQYAEQLIQKTEVNSL